jgi:asparagine synthase (glutamine-hydrolysing)
MCGIAGFWSAHRAMDMAELTATATRMGDAIRHRGPDDSGTWVDATQGIALAHRRLSILDLSAEGHQPMKSASARYIISFNGEIYNYRDLRRELNHPWRGNSDTEVILACFEQYGIAETLTRLNGMFALAVWDNKERALTLARDRFGEKPLYYGWSHGRLVFASELKAFRALPDWSPRLNHAALASFLQFSYVPQPLSIYEDIHKLPPAHSLTLRHAGDTTSEPVCYWSLAAIADASSRMPASPLSRASMIESVAAQLRHSVKDRMVSDVPLGAFLSGGIDSSTIVALMQEQSARPIQTYTIGFHDAAFDEAPYARAIARHLGTDHHEHYVTPEEALAVVPLLPTLYDEPFADASQIPTYLVSKHARQSLTVVLSGDGGDELFGGYNRYLRGPQLWQLIAWLPYACRAPIASAMRGLHGVVNRHPRLRTSLFSNKLLNYYEKIETRDATAFYRNLTSIYQQAHPRLIRTAPYLPPLPGRAPGMSYASWMMLADSLTYFPDDILVKVDRAAMGVSLETRTPFTDPDLVSLIWKLGDAARLQGGTSKWVLREILAGFVPREMFERPKAGFGVPLDAWLRGPLKSWAEDLLFSDSLRQDDALNLSAIHAIWHDHQNHVRAHGGILWNVLSYASWRAAG